MRLHAGSLITSTYVAEHPLPSTTIRVYVPADSDEIFGKIEVNPLGPYQENEYAPFPPEIEELIDPSFAPFKETFIVDKEIDIWLGLII